MKVVKDETRIKRCVHCPYADSLTGMKGRSFFVCCKTMKRTKNHISVRRLPMLSLIPDWCPLEDAE